MTPTMLRLAAFIAGSAGLAWISRTSLKNPRTHGSFRWLAWEAILGLIVINVGHWFHDPLHWNQIASWLCLIVSGFLATYGAYLLHRLGAPSRLRVDPTLVGVERTTTLVTSGAYRYIRHPLYASLLFLAWGVFLKSTTKVSAVLIILATGLLIITAKIEERENIAYFGNVYRGYIKRTRMFIPKIF